jgi:prepilin peptidase CpaA
MGQPLNLPALVVLVAALAAAVTDLRAFKIHNLLTLPLLVSGLVYHAAVGGKPGLLDSFLGMLFGFGILFLFYLLGGMGGGDVKLMAGVGAWLGAPLTFVVFVASSLAAGVYALAVVLFTRSGRETWLNLKIVWFRVAAVGRHLGADDGGRGRGALPRPPPPARPLRRHDGLRDRRRAAVRLGVARCLRAPPPAGPARSCGGFRVRALIGSPPGWACRGESPDESPHHLCSQQDFSQAEGGL